MQYLGGKKRLAKHIATILEAHRSDGQRFVDVFCGGLSITAAMSDRGPRVANDGCKPLIVLYEAWREGWRPPPITEDLYREVKAKQDPNDPLTAFVGFGCSYGGKWFGGFARGFDSPNKLYDGIATRSLDRLLPQCSHVRFTSLDFDDVDVQSGDLVYADPEYKGTTRYSYFRSFDYPRFLRAVTRWRSLDATVIVSEYAAHATNWQQLNTWTSKRNIANANKTEKLFKVG